MQLPPNVLSRPDRRAAFRASYANAFLWAIGNGLTSTTLIFYLAMDFGASGVWVSLIVASPQLVGMLRLATPKLLQWAPSRIGFACTSFALSNLLLLALPLLLLAGVLSAPQQVLTATVVLWAGYHLLEYVGVVALWSYLRDLAPRAIRGRFTGRRERWLLAGQVLGMLAAGLFSYAYRAEDSALRTAIEMSSWNFLSLELPSARWVGLALPALVGPLCMLSSLLPLARLPRLAAARPQRVTSANLWAPWTDRSFRWLLLFIAWFGLTNGLTQTAQALFPYRVLSFSALTLLALRSNMLVWQSVTAATVGRWIDRWGNRPVMIGSVLLVAGGPLCYLAAAWVHPALFGVAWLLWIAYVGLNIGLPNLTWKLSGREYASAYLAIYLAVSGLAYAVGSIAGGVLFEKLTSWNSNHSRPLPVDPYTLLFVGGWLLRTAGVVWLAMIQEPQANNAAAGSPNQKQ